MNKSKNRESIEHFKDEKGGIKASIEGSDKQKFALHITPQSMETINLLYKSDNCSSRSEFIEKAVKFYTGYICASKSVKAWLYLTRYVAKFDYEKYRSDSRGAKD